MLRHLDPIRNFILEAYDGEIGRCKDFLFDDRFWAVRYMVADTGKWLPKRKVLISPISLGRPDWHDQRLPVKLSKERIEGSPPLESDMPVSRQYEIRWFDYYRWPYYWLGPGAWGAVPNPSELYEQQQDYPKPEDIHPEKSHLRSAKEVRGYHVQARDDEFGHVEDFLADDRSWMIRYIVVDTRNWLPGRKVIVSPHWAEAVDWPRKKLHFRLSREQIRNSPEYEPSQAVEREYEAAVHDHYGIPPYWE
jgi:hypothetical protein